MSSPASLTLLFMKTGIFKIGDEVIAIKDGMDCDNADKLRRGQTKRANFAEPVGNGPFDYIVGDIGEVVGLHQSGALDIVVKKHQLFKYKLPFEYYQVAFSNWMLFSYYLTNMDKPIPLDEEKQVVPGRLIEIGEDDA